MTSIPVRLGSRSYRIVIVEGGWRPLAGALRGLALGRDGVVVTHRAIRSRYGRPLAAALRRAGCTVRFIEVPATERSKSLAWSRQILEHLAAGDRMRRLFLVALGGGVVGDLTGFAAAVYKRGVPYIQVPTTLLAQVDSAIGGKTGVDLPQGKNLVGAFYQPRLVFSTLETARSLPVRQLRNGLAEVVKYGVIADPNLFGQVERAWPRALRGDVRVLRRFVEASSRIKARVVGADERDTGGIRVALNFGHTIGHALEAATGYARYGHGEAIAVGMVCAADVAEALGWFRRAEARRLEHVLCAMGLPTRARGVSVRRVVAAMRRDKKFQDGRYRFVLPRRIGRVAVCEAVPAGIVRRVLRQRLAER